MTIFFKKKKDEPVYVFDPDKEKPVIRASICNGEQVAGFKDNTTGKFQEIMLIKNEKDLSEFMNTYGLEHVDKEY